MKLLPATDPEAAASTHNHRPGPLPWRPPTPKQEKPQKRASLNRDKRSGVQGNASKEEAARGRRRCPLWWIRSLGFHPEHPRPHGRIGGGFTAAPPTRYSNTTGVAAACPDRDRSKVFTRSSRTHRSSAGPKSGRPGSHDHQASPQAGETARQAEPLLRPPTTALQHLQDLDRIQHRAVDRIQHRAAAPGDCHPCFPQPPTAPPGRRRRTTERRPAAAPPEPDPRRTRFRPPRGPRRPRPEAAAPAHRDASAQHAPRGRRQRRASPPTPPRRDPAPTPLAARAPAATAATASGSGGEEGRAEGSPGGGGG